MTNKLFIGIAAFMLVGAFASCSSDEELTASGATDNYFAVRADDTSEDAAIRRAFYDKNGIFLLFNDTLRHELVGKDVAGKDAYFTETIDFNYNINTAGISDFQFSYLKTTEEKKAAVDFVEKYIVPHFKGGALAPYSFFLADNLSEYGYSYTTWQYEWMQRTYLSCVRCIGLSVGDVVNMDDDQKADYALQISRSILETRLKYNDERLGDFYAPVQDLFNEYLENIIPGWQDSAYDGSIDVPASYGFLKLDSTLDWNTWEDIYYFPGQQNDYKAYFNIVMGSSEEEVYETYGKYPIVISRYNTLRNIISSLGYNF